MERRDCFALNENKKGYQKLLDVTKSVLNTLNVYIRQIESKKKHSYETRITAN